jgi:PadR family transcriptional regulator, regulatory protein PadR
MGVRVCRYWRVGGASSAARRMRGAKTNLRRYLDGLHKSVVDKHSMGKPNDLVQGTLDLLILKTIQLEPMHGWAIAKRIQQVSGEVLQVQQGSLYPALHRLEQQAWIKAKWAESETGRQAKFYSLTVGGRKQLGAEQANWSRLSAAINLIVSEA